MKLTCPNCHEQLSLAALIEHDAAREAVRLALEFPAPLSKLILQYTGLFKPAQRALSMEKFAAILSELLPKIKAAQIERNGRLWSAPQAYWQEAFEQMLSGKNGLTLPLKSHGYLFEVIAGLGNKAEAKAEKQQEQGRKYGALPPAANPVPTTVGAQLIAPEKAEAKQEKRKPIPEEALKTIRKLTGKKT